MDMKQETREDWNLVRGRSHFEMTTAHGPSVSCSHIILWPHPTGKKKKMKVKDPGRTTGTHHKNGISVFGRQVHNILAEMVMGGMVLETNMNEIITQVDAQNKMEKSEVSAIRPASCMWIYLVLDEVYLYTVSRHVCMLHPACSSLVDAPPPTLECLRSSFLLLLHCSQQIQILHIPSSAPLNKIIIIIKENPNHHFLTSLLWRPKCTIVPVHLWSSGHRWHHFSLPYWERRLWVSVVQVRWPRWRKCPVWDERVFQTVSAVYKDVALLLIVLQWAETHSYWSIEFSQRQFHEIISVLA